MKLVMFVVAFFWSLMSYAAPTEGQWTHGGDPVIASVYESIQKTHQNLKKLPKVILPYEGFADDFNEVYQRVEISLKDKLVWKGQDVTAINYPWAAIPKLEVSSERWILLKDDSERQRIVLHEFLFLLKIDDTDYVESRRLSRLLESYERRDLKVLLSEGTNHNKLFPGVNQWSEFIAVNASYFADGAEALYWLVSSQYVGSAEWLQLFKSVLLVTPLRMCNFLVSQAYINLMLEGDLNSQAAIHLLQKKGFSPNPSVDPNRALCN